MKNHQVSVNNVLLWKAIHVVFTGLIHFTHQVTKLSSYRNQSIDLQGRANQLTGFYMMAKTLAFNSFMTEVQSKSMDWYLYDKHFCHGRVNELKPNHYKNI